MHGYRLLEYIQLFAVVFIALNIQIVKQWGAMVYNGIQWYTMGCLTVLVRNGLWYICHSVALG